VLVIHGRIRVRCHSGVGIRWIENDDIIFRQLLQTQLSPVECCNSRACACENFVALSQRSLVASGRNAAIIIPGLNKGMVVLCVLSAELRDLS
jgi:hypothetical protein